MTPRYVLVTGLQAIELARDMELTLYARTLDGACREVDEGEARELMRRQDTLVYAAIEARTP